MGNRTIKKVTPSMKWSRKRWATKGRLRAVSSQLRTIITEDILTNKEKRSILAIIARLETIDKHYHNSGTESKANWLREERIKAYNANKRRTK